MSSASPTSTAGQLHKLCREGNVTEIRLLLREISDVNKLDERLGFLGYTPLHEATNMGQTSVVRLLLLFGANPNARANGFYTPLHIAASMDNLECIEELLKYNADITSKDEFEKTPYETAVINNCKKTARILKTEEVKKAARENSPNLRALLTLISPRDVLQSCFKEAVLEASRGGHLNAICSLIISGGRHSLHLKDCIVQALQGHFCEAAAMLLACYASKHDKRKLLKYLLKEEMSREEEQKALAELPAGVWPTDNDFARIRASISDKDSFRTAIPIGLGIQQRRIEAVGIILLNTNCNEAQKRIDWPRLALGDVDPSWLEKVTWVEKLFLASNLLTSVPRNITILKKLCCLDLRRNQLRSVPATLFEMPNLRELKLCNNKIVELPKQCKWSSSLKTLNLSDNQLQTLPSSMAEAKLSIFYIARNNLYEVPTCICAITTLQSLDLSGNPRLTQLPPQMGRLTNIEMLKLENLDQLTDPPEEIKKNGIKTIMYLRNILRRSDGYYTLKLMLVGRAEQGKTTLKHRLMRDYTYNVNKSTNGIAMDEFRYNRSALFAMNPEFVFKIWDFGGQEDFYITHQCFLSTLALYLLVWNLEEGESGIEMLTSWLDTIAASAANTNLIIVGTHLDKVRKNKEKGFPERMRELVWELVSLPKYNRINVKGIKEVSCALDNREGIDNLRVTIYDVARSLQKSGRGQVLVMGEKIPHSFLSVADVIKTKRQELRDEGRMPILHKSEYEALVLDTIKNDPLDIEDTNDLTEVTQFMHERGILMHYNDPNQDLQDLFFIDPQWLCELMAQVVTLPVVNPFIYNGILKLEDLPQIFRGERFPHDNSPQFIRLLNRFQIACSLDEDRILIPSRLTSKEPDEATNDDLPFITLKRLHSLPYIPHGFWCRLISRLLFYMKDMLSSGENLNRQGYNISPFQLDPLCCRCPLAVDDITGGGPVESDFEGHPSPSINPSLGGSFENLQGFLNDSPGLVQFFSGQRQGNYINGRFFAYPDIYDGSPRSDSGFEYSSEDDDEARARLEGNTSRTFPSASSRDGPRRRNRRLFKHGTDPGRQGQDDTIVDLDSGTPKSDSNVPILRQNFCLGSSCPSYEDGSCGTLISEVSCISPREPQGSSTPDHRPSANCMAVNENALNLPRRREPHDVEAGQNLQDISKRENPSEKIDSLLKVKTTQHCNSDDSDSIPYLSAGSRSCTPDHTPCDQTDNYQNSSDSEAAPDNPDVGPDKKCNDRSPTVTCEVPEIGHPGESLVEDDPKRSPQLTEDCSRGPHNQQSIVEHEVGGEMSSVLNDRIFEEEFSTESFHTGSSWGSGETGDEFMETRTLDDDKMIAAGNHFSDSTANGVRIEVGKNYFVSNLTSHSSPCTSSQSADVPIGTPRRTSSFAASTPTHPTDGTSVENGGDTPRNLTLHLPSCPFVEEYPVDFLPELPTDLATLIDDGFLHCWKSGVCLRHPRLFLLLHCVVDTGSNRQIIHTEVSPSRQGRKVLSFVVDHIDTIIREWYQELLMTDGKQPKVRQLIPCMMCEKLGLPPYKFAFADCQHQSSKSDFIRCPNHPKLVVDLHQVAPDIMLHDIDPDLLLSHEDISYEDAESSVLGCGGFGTVFRGECRGQAVAIKFYIQSDESDPLRHYREARKELNVLRRVRQHPFLINIIGVSLRPLCLVLELAERGPLTEVVSSPKLIDRIVLFRIAYQVADALRFLHDMGVIYRDLKPENVLVWSLEEDSDLHVKLIDFGTANFTTSTGLISCAGTPGNHAPEMLESANKEEYTFQVDVYSYAILLYRLITRLTPFIEYDSGPKINAAVIAGERPQWQHVSVAFFGLPTLTELMLRCWSGRPTKRPTTCEITEQVCHPAFQCLIAKQPVPSEQQSVRHACLVQNSLDLWLACDDHTGNRIFVYDGRTLSLKFSFSIESYQEQHLLFQIQCMHVMATFVIIAVRGEVALVNTYSTSSESRYKCVASMSFDQPVSCVASNDEYVFVGLFDGNVRCILKTDMKKSSKKRAPRTITVGRHRILSLSVAQDKLWVSTSRYIYRYLTKPGEVEAFDIDAVWYGGPEGMENNPQTQISFLKVSRDEKSVLSVCRSVLSKWDSENRQNHFSVDCANLLRSLAAETESHQDHDDVATCITCVEPTNDSIWVGIASGHLMIFDSETGQLLTWFHPFDEARSLTLVNSPGPCGTEQGYVISTGKGLRPDGLGPVCKLSAERVKEIPKEDSNRKVSEPERKKTSTGRKLRTPTPPIDGHENDAIDANPTSRPKCSMIMWELLSKKGFARLEAKSGRERFSWSYSAKAKCSDQSLQNGDENYEE